MSIFNYGHSFGHAIESATNFGIPHGIAVTIGMDMANSAAVHFGFGSQQHKARMKPTLAANFKGYENTKIPIDAFISAISKDKKNLGANQLTLILPNKDGRIEKCSYPNDEGFAKFCAGYLQAGRH